MWNMKCVFNQSNSFATKEEVQFALHFISWELSRGSGQGAKMATLYLWHYQGILRVLPSCRAKESGGHWHYFYLLPLEWGCTGGECWPLRLWGFVLHVGEQPDSLSWVGAKGQTGHVIRHFRPAYRGPDSRGLKNLKTPPTLLSVSLLPFFSLSPLCPLSLALSLFLDTKCHLLSVSQ